MARGWSGDSARHALASKGIKTAFDKDKSPNTTQTPIEAINGEFKRLGLSNASLHEKSFEKIKELNKHNPDAEWIADLDFYDNGNIVLNDFQVTMRPDESQLYWNDYASDDDPHSDPEYCIGYIHYHPPEVDKRPSAQDFVLALTIHGLRTDDNKKRSLYTMFAVVINNALKIYSIKVDNKEEVEDMKEKFQAIQDKNLPTVEYFEETEKLMKKLEDEYKLVETGWLPIE